MVADSRRSPCDSDRGASEAAQSGRTQPQPLVPVGQAFFQGNWTWFALVIVMVTFNTVLGEELLFRGLLLPMQGAFGKGAWLVNASMFGLYHLHQPWGMPGSILRGLVYSYSTQRYRSEWFGIILHSLSSVMLIVMLLMLVLK